MHVNVNVIVGALGLHPYGACLLAPTAPGNATNEWVGPVARVGVAEGRAHVRENRATYILQLDTVQSKGVSVECCTGGMGVGVGVGWRSGH